MRLFFIATALIAAAAPAYAEETPPAVRTGLLLLDANNARLGQIDRVYPDGSVRIIYGTRFVTIPAATIGAANGKIVTTLKRREVERLK